MIFRGDDTWSGGYYELAIELPTDHASVAIHALWTFPDLDGCYADRDRDPTDQARIAPNTTHDLFGVARIPAGHVACRTVLIRYDADGGDWLHFMLPMGSLATVLPVGAYPFDDGSDLAWRDALDAWLCSLARHAYKHVPFARALVGWDVGADSDAVGAVPDERTNGYLVSTADGLTYFAPNQRAPLSLK